MVSTTFESELFGCILAIYAIAKCLADPCVITCSASNVGAKYCDPLDRHSYFECVAGFDNPTNRLCASPLVCVQLTPTAILCDRGTTGDPAVTVCPPLQPEPPTTAQETSTHEHVQTIVTTSDVHTTVQLSTRPSPHLTGFTAVPSTPKPSNYETKSTQYSTTIELHQGTQGQTSSQPNIVIIASATAGAALALILAGIVTVVVIKRRAAARGKPETSLRLSAVDGHPHPTTEGTANGSFSGHTNVADLYAKPDKKRRNPQQSSNTADPEDPSYQDVLPTGAQHQYATVPDDSHPYNAVGDETNLYDSIQDDPQYATVQKGHKQGPNVKANPLYGKGSVDNTVYDPGLPPNDNERVPSVCEMMDNIIYE